MARTTNSAVQNILLENYDGESSLTPFVETADLVVNDLVDLAAADGLAYTAVRLELIARWLAAHFYCQSDKPYSFKLTEGASANFDGATAMYFESTLFGQTAVRIDTHGLLSANPKMRLGGQWLGLRLSEQTDYADRS